MGLPDDLPDYYDNLLWPQKRTWPLVLKLLRDTANNNGNDVADDKTMSRFAHEVHTAVRIFRRSFSSRIIVRCTNTNSGRTQRVTYVRWRSTRGAALQQLRTLDIAAKSRSAYMFEKAWLGLNGDARYMLASGFRAASEAGALRQFKGELEEPGAVVAAMMPSRDILRVLVPYAIRLAARPGRPRARARDEALALLLDTFMQIAIPNDGRQVRHGAWAAIIRNGFPFVHKVEEIFAIKVTTQLPERDLGRAREFMRNMPRASCLR